MSNRGDMDGAFTVHYRIVGGLGHISIWDRYGDKPVADVVMGCTEVKNIFDKYRNEIITHIHGL